MAEWVIPVEKETGIPFALAPRYDTPQALKSKPGEFDWHHAVPRRRFAATTSVSAVALKGARVEFVEYNEHRSYHHYFDEYFDTEWVMPKRVLGRYGRVVLLGAGYIPELGIRCRRSGPEYVHLSARQREFMWSRGIIRVENEMAVFDFIQDMVVSQPLDLDSTVVQEFAFSEDEQVRLQRGNELLEAAADLASEPVREQYRQAYLGRLVPPELPSDPREFVLGSPLILGTEKRRRRTRTKLRRRIGNELGVELPDAA